MTLSPIRLLPSFREKIWGSTHLAPWFADGSAKIGEVWLTADDNCAEDGRTVAALLREYGPALVGTWAGESFPFLIKFIFTSERLSIQVHPDDERARAWENSPGKTEMWRVLRGGPESAVALGFVAGITRERLREAALSGEIERLVRWFPVRGGEVLFTPAGAVHAIGAGLALCEIQQNSDVTYRLYDYGRPRELHLEKGVAVSDLGPHPGPSTPQDCGEGCKLLARCPYFVTEEVEWRGSASYAPKAGRLETLVFLEGAGELAGRPFQAGQCWLIPASAGPFRFDARDAVRLLRVYVP